MKVTLVPLLRRLGPPCPSLPFLHTPITIFMLSHHPKRAALPPFKTKSPESRYDAFFSVHQLAPFPQNFPSLLSPSGVSVRCGGHAYWRVKQKKHSNKLPGPYSPFCLSFYFFHALLSQSNSSLRLCTLTTGKHFPLAIWFPFPLLQSVLCKAIVLLYLSFLFF